MTVTDARKLESLLQEGWDLSELLPEASETVVSSRIADLEASVSAFENWRTELSPKLSPDRLVELLEDYETLVSKLIVLGFYGSLWFSSDTQSQAALDYRNRIEQVPGFCCACLGCTGDLEIDRWAELTRQLC